MFKIPRIRRNLTALTALSLAAAVLIPTASIATAASALSQCPTYSEGSTAAQCDLVVSNPETVLTYQTFTVQVAVTASESGPIPSSDPCAPVRVTLTLFQSEPGAPTAAAPSSGANVYSATTRNGVATFTVSVTSAGFWELQATAPSSSTCSYFTGYGNTSAVYIPQSQPIAPCPPNVSCTQTWSGGGSAATLFADDGVFNPAFFGPADSALISACGGGPLEPNGALTFDYTGTSATKTIVFALASNLVTKGIGQFNICWKGTVFFTPAGGGPQTTTGLLPNCGKNATGPCVLFRKSNRKNVGFFGVLAPGGDPVGYPR